MATATMPAPLDEKLRDLLALTERLADLVEQENDLLGRERPSAIRPLLEEKERLTGRFAMDISLVRGDTRALAQCDGATRKALRESLERFQNASLRNGRLLRKLKLMGDDMISTIVAHVNPAARRTTYANPASGTALRTAPQTIALNAVV